MKKIIYIHGRNYKPNHDVLEANWDKAISTAIKRDFGSEMEKKFSNTLKEMAYYGDITNDFLGIEKYNMEDDIRDREECLSQLCKYQNKDFNEKNYDNLPGKSSCWRILSSIVSTPLYYLGIGGFVAKKAIPDMKDYWNMDSAYGSKVRWTLTETLRDSLKNGDEVLLISHSLGTMISYDVLWKFSYYGEYKDIRDKKLHTWITMGSPLSDETIKSKLKGAKAKAERKYPTNVGEWYNVAAKDDYLSHDPKLKNDFKDMKTDLIEDISVYNLSVRKSKSNPHHASGYLVTPEVVKLIASWLER